MYVYIYINICIYMYIYGGRQDLAVSNVGVPERISAEHSCQRPSCVRILIPRMAVGCRV